MHPVVFVRSAFGQSPLCSLLRSLTLAALAMGKPLTDVEMDSIQKWKADSLTPIGIHTLLVKERKRRRQEGPDLTTVRRFVKGKTHKRSATETRGRKPSLTKTNLKTMDRTRDKLITKADCEREISWDEVVRKSRVPTVDRTTAANHMKKEFGVQAMRPRAKLTRNDIDEAERKRICNRLRKLPRSYWTSTIHLTMDNKRWPFPVSLRGKKYLRQTKVRFVLRNKKQGLKKGYTKPDKRKHRTNLGGVNLVAGIIKGKVRVWHYFDGKWTGEKAAEVYKTVVAPALRRVHGKKRQYTIIEDNDPVGYKSTAGNKAKADLNIVPIEFPTYSPDMNACDYALWDEVERRMSEQVAPKHETREQFKARLRRTAFGIPKDVVLNMLGSMVGRTQCIYEENGGHIPRD
ncbi:MAG: hypothetical protein CME32_12675 [Gimesia sp.]|nr:hypothetical protein [Gimesia sp.]